MKDKKKPRCERGLKKNDDSVMGAESLSGVKSATDDPLDLQPRLRRICALARRNRLERAACYGQEVLDWWRATGRRAFLVEDFADYLERRGRWRKRRSA